MSAWFTVYSRQRIKCSAKDIARALDQVDFYSVTEGFGIDDDAVVEQALKALCLEAVSGKFGEWLHIRYKKGKLRPLTVYRWKTAKRVREELTETEDNYLACRKERGVEQVRKALDDVVEVWAVELGLIQLEDMGLVIAGQVAEHLADVTGGILRDTNDEWWTVRKGVPKLVLGNDG